MKPIGQSFSYGMLLQIAVLALNGAITPAHAQETKPNVVVMLADNMGYGDLGAYGSAKRAVAQDVRHVDRDAGRDDRHAQRDWLACEHDVEIACVDRCARQRPQCTGRRQSDEQRTKQQQPRRAAPHRPSLLYSASVEAAREAIVTAMIDHEPPLAEARIPTTVQPGGGLCFGLETAWGRARR